MRRAASPSRPPSTGCARRSLMARFRAQVALKLKYGGRPGVAETMARFMARHLDAGRGLRCSRRCRCTAGGSGGAATTSRR